jgi:hypothetical protein
LRSAKELLAVARDAGSMLRVIRNVGESLVAFARLFPIPGREFMARITGQFVLRNIMIELRVAGFRLRSGFRFRAALGAPPLGLFARCSSLRAKHRKQKGANGYEDKRGNFWSSISHLSKVALSSSFPAGQSSGRALILQMPVHL